MFTRILSPRRRIEMLLAEQRKVHAIQLFREATGATLLTSNGAIDSFLDHGRWPDEHLEKLEPGREESLDLDSGKAEMFFRAEEHLIAGRRVAAMKEFRDATGAGLRQAKEAVAAYLLRGEWRSEDLALIAVGASASPVVEPAKPDPVPTHRRTVGLDPSSTGLREHLGPEAEPLAVVRAMYRLTRGCLVVLEDRVLFVREIFGRCNTDLELSRDEIASVQVRDDEVIVRWGYSEHRFRNLTREDTALLARLLGDRGGPVGG